MEDDKREVVQEISGGSEGENGQDKVRLIMPEEEHHHHHHHHHHHSNEHHSSEHHSSEHHSGEHHSGEHHSQESGESDEHHHEHHHEHHSHEDGDSHDHHSSDSSDSRHHHHHHRHHHRHHHSESESKKETKPKSLGKRIVMRFLPFVIAGVGIALIAFAAVNIVIDNSRVISAFISEVNAEGGDGLNTDMQTVDISKIDGKLDINQFPVIKWGDQWATLSIPSQNVKDKAVFLGDNEIILDKMVIGTYFGSTYPGINGKTVLDCHVSSTFHCLEDMKEGDEIILNTIYGEYVYEVREVFTFTPRDRDVVIQDKNGSDEDTLICYTCYPRNAIYRKDRIGVRCVRVSGVPWSEEG